MFQAAVETDFPTVRFRGCYFHFSKAILSKIKDLGLFTPYKNDRRLNQFIRKFIAIGFLPVFYVRQKFHQVLQEASTRLLVSRFTNLSVFLNYFEATWLHQFPPNIYNVYASQSTLRTINACEGYNNRLNTRVGRRIHPNFWVFVKSLQMKKTWQEDLTGDSNWATKLIFLKEKMEKLKRNDLQRKTKIRNAIA